MQSALGLRPSYHLRFYQHRLLQKITGLRRTRKKKLSFMSFQFPHYLLAAILASYRPIKLVEVDFTL